MNKIGVDIKNIWRGLCFPLIIIALACAALSCSSQTTSEPSPAETESASDLIAQAEKLYAQREDLTRARAAIVAVRRARTIEYNNYEAAWRLAKFNYYLGDHTTNDDERDKAFREGVEAGEAAVRLQPDKPDGHFWLGANLGGRAQTSAISGLASVSDIRKEMETVLRLDEGYAGGSAYMALGQLELETKWLGGDPKKAVEYLEKGVRFSETNALMRLRLAEAYLAVKRNDDARKTLNTIFNMAPDPDYLPEHKETVEEARKLLQKIS